MQSGYFIRHGSEAALVVYMGTVPRKHRARRGRTAKEKLELLCTTQLRRRTQAAKKTNKLLGQYAEQQTNAHCSVVWLV